jgi:hypothetical protein
MLIAVYYTDHGEDLWACASSLEPIIADLTRQAGEEIDPIYLKVFRAEEVKVSMTMVAKWDVLPD